MKAAIRGWATNNNHMMSCSSSGGSGQGAWSLLTPRSPCCCWKWLRITQCWWTSKMGRCTVGTWWAATTGWTSTCSEVMCTSRNRDKLWWVPECCIHSSTINSLTRSSTRSRGRWCQGPWQQWLQQQKGPGKGTAGRGRIPGTGRDQPEKQRGRQTVSQLSVPQRLSCHHWAAPTPKAAFLLSRLWVSLEQKEAGVVRGPPTCHL